MSLTEEYHSNGNKSKQEFEMRISIYLLTQEANPFNNMNRMHILFPTISSHLLTLPVKSVRRCGIFFSNQVSGESKEREEGIGNMK